MKKSCFADLRAVGMQMVAILAFQTISATGCSLYSPISGDSCDNVTDTEFCKSVTVLMACEVIADQQKWTEIECTCVTQGQGLCVEDADGAHCECIEDIPELGDPCDKATDMDFCRTGYVLMSCSRSVSGEERWIEIDCICVPQGQGICAVEEYGAHCKCT